MKKTEFIKRLRDYIKKSKSVLVIPADSFSDISAEEFKTLWDENRESILKIRGVDSTEVLRGSWTDSYVIYSKPCKEFEELNRYLEKWKLRKIGIHEIMIDYISGKRSSIDFEDRDSFAYKPELCEKLLEFIKCGSIGTAGKVKIENLEFKDYGDRYNSYGEDLEMEWSGRYCYGLRITVYTRALKLRATEEFWL